MANRIGIDGVVLLGVFEMKTINNILEVIIIVLLVPILLLPEMLYFILVRVRNKVEMIINEL